MYFQNLVFPDTSEQRVLSGYSVCTEQGRKQAHQFHHEFWDIWKSTFQNVIIYLNFVEGRNGTPEAAGIPRKS